MDPTDLYSLLSGGFVGCRTIPQSLHLHTKKSEAVSTKSVSPTAILCRESVYPLAQGLSSAVVPCSVLRSSKIQFSFQVPQVMAQDNPNLDSVHDCLVQSLLDDGLSRFTNGTNPALLRHIAKVQMDWNKGDVQAAISKSKMALLNMERAVETLQEYEQLMDKAYFEDCIKGDTIMVSGIFKNGNRIVVWSRVGLLCDGIWRLQIGSPKAYAFIRAVVFQFQAALVHALLKCQHACQSPDLVVVLDNVCSLIRRVDYEVLQYKEF